MQRIDTRRLFDGNGLTLIDTAWRREDHPASATVRPATAVFEFMREGSFVYRDGVLGSRAAHVDATAIALFNPEREVVIDHPSGESNAGTTLRVALDVLHEVAHAARVRLPRREHELFACASVPSPAAVYIAQRRALALAQSASNDADGVEEALLALVERALSAIVAPARVRSGAVAVSRFARGRVLAAQSMIAERFRGRCTLDDVARAVGISRFQLCRAFSSLTGRTIHDTLVELRVRAAVERIAEGERSLTAVALACGFASHSHLTDTFRARLAVSPASLRRAIGTFSRSSSPGSCRSSSTAPSSSARPTAG